MCMLEIWTWVVMIGQQAYFTQGVFSSTLTWQFSRQTRKEVKVEKMEKNKVQNRVRSLKKRVDRMKGKKTPFWSGGKVTDEGNYSWTEPLFSEALQAASLGARGFMGLDDIQCMPRACDLLLRPGYTPTSGCLCDLELLPGDSSCHSMVTKSTDFWNGVCTRKNSR